MLTPMPLHRPTVVSEEEFLELPESMDRVELLDGEVIVSPSPSVWHQELLARLAHALRSWAYGHNGPVFIGQAPLDVRFGPGRILQPDLFVTFGEVALDHQGPLDLVPDLCVEVLSTNRAFDRLTKRLVYGEAGVPELWLIEPSGVVERWSGHGLGEAEVLATDLTTPLLPGLEIDLTALFRKG
jgi:Uma2 family endonuclease